MSAVTVRRLFRVYPGDRGGAGAAALQGLDLDAAAGETLVILGPSGSGKTTLLRILGGLERPSAGSVRVLGLDLAVLRGRRLVGYRSAWVGYLDQHFAAALAPELTAREQVELPLALRGEDRRSRTARADELLELVGLADRRGARPLELSGGEQQRVALCAAVARAPRLLLADEPTGELDAESSRVVYGAIAALAGAEGMTVVLVSHDAHAVAIADRVVEIRDGRASREVRGGDGSEGALVVSREGWLRLPEELRRTSGIASGAVARGEGRSVVLEAGRWGGGYRADDGAPPAPARRGSRSGREAVRLAGVGKTRGYGAAATAVLRGLDAAVPAGALTVVTGPSGSGKTTLLHLVAGLLLPDVGSVVVDGVEVSALSRAERARFRRTSVGFVEQGGELLPALTVAENVELTLALRERRDAQFTSLLERLGIGELADARVARLSSGERQRAAIARALAADPRVVVADEPTARLDEANSAAVADVLVETAHDLGITILSATHDPVVIARAGARIELG